MTDHGNPGDFSMNWIS
ncbi:hypothetical protein Gohar_015764 [Gossypium harknessii]|uniref:Uncharacterized protein n=1 Tax=Gossypium harknessii TaxID=34285 RepID=A0A7J9G0Q5_9ROSI|nr:hypothetical protein [Gossypium harknessii]